MNLKNLAQKALAPTVAFVCVGIGGLLVLPRGDSQEQRLPTVVVTSDLEDGTKSSTVRNSAEVRLLPAEARASGALSTIQEIPDGVLAYRHTAGQQLVVSSFATDRIAALGSDFVAVSIRVDSPRWVGPLVTTGRVVDVYDAGPQAVTLIASNAVVVDAPDPSEIDAKDESIVVLGVKKSSLEATIRAASAGTIWLVGS